MRSSRRLSAPWQPFTQKAANILDQPKNPLAKLADLITVHPHKALTVAFPDIRRRLSLVLGLGFPQTITSWRELTDVRGLHALVFQQDRCP